MGFSNANSIADHLALKKKILIYHFIKLSRFAIKISGWKEIIVLVILLLKLHAFYEIVATLSVLWR